MENANTPEGTGDTALNVNEAAEAITGLLSDDPLTDTDAPEDTQDDEAEAQDAEDSEADEAEEDDAEADEPEDDADEEEEPEADGPLQFSEDLQVQLEDGSVVSLGDLNKGNLRQADYTRKTQDLAEVKREYEEKNQQIQGAAQDLVHKFEVFEQLLAQTAPQRPTREMAESDFIGAQTALIAWQEHQERLHEIQGHLQQARGYQEQQKQAQKQQEMEKASQELFAWNPTLVDPVKRKAFGDKLLADVSVYGFTAQDFQEFSDIRIIKALADAARYQNLQKSKPKAIKKARKAPPLTKPQQRQSGDGNKRRAQAKQMQKLRKTGSVADAAPLLEDYID